MRNRKNENVERGRGKRRENTIKTTPENRVVAPGPARISSETNDDERAPNDPKAFTVVLIYTPHVRVRFFCSYACASGVVFFPLVPFRPSAAPTPPQAAPPPARARSRRSSELVRPVLGSYSRGVPNGSRYRDGARVILRSTFFLPTHFRPVRTRARSRRGVVFPSARLRAHSKDFYLTPENHRRNILSRNLFETYALYNEIVV